MVQSLLALLRFRNTHPAFGGAMQLVPAPSDTVVLEWRDDGAFARLEVRLAQMSATITCSGEGIESWPW